MGSCCSTPINPTQIDLSHFRIHRVLGRGGFGRVNAVENRQTNELFAMKALKKAQLIERESSFETCWLERKCMSQFRSNFLVTCIHAFQDLDYLYLVMPLMEGGDLRYYLQKNGTFTEAECKFYVAQIILALEEMHSINIIYRDLKPENCLLDGSGWVRVSDFGLAYQLNPQNRSNHDGKTAGYCGTSGYISPEILRKQRYSYSVDYFSLGVMIYELLHHRLPKLPFYKELKEKYKKENGPNKEKDKKETEDFVDSSSSSQLQPIEKEKEEIYFSSRLTPACIELVTGLLASEPEERLGCRSSDRGWETIKSHSWFSDINWSLIANKQARPPFTPDTSVANCDPIYELEEQIMNSHEKPRQLTKTEQARFIGWEFHTKRIPDGSGRYLDDHTLSYDFTIDNNLNRHFEYSTTSGPAWMRDFEPNPLDDDNEIEPSRNERWEIKSENDPELEIGDISVHEQSNGTNANGIQSINAGVSPSYDRTKDAALIKGAEAKSPRRLSGYHQMI
jgi:serine/threonine kinase 32